MDRGGVCVCVCVSVCQYVVLTGRGWTRTRQRAVLVHPPSVSSVCLSGTCRSVARRSLLSTGCFFAHCLADADLRVLYLRRISFPLFPFFFFFVFSLCVFLTLSRIASSGSYFSGEAGQETLLYGVCAAYRLTVPRVVFTWQQQPGSSVYAQSRRAPSVHRRDRTQDEVLCIPSRITGEKQRC